jgi:hypothetical protein
MKSIVVYLTVSSILSRTKARIIARIADDLMKQIDF